MKSNPIFFFFHLFARGKRNTFCAVSIFSSRRRCELWRDFRSTNADGGSISFSLPPSLSLTFSISFSRGLYFRCLSENFSSVVLKKVSCRNGNKISYGLNKNSFRVSEIYLFRWRKVFWTLIRVRRKKEKNWNCIRRRAGKRIA